MSQYDHEAIRKAYPNVVVIRDDDGIYEQTGTDENEGAYMLLFFSVCVAILQCSITIFSGFRDNTRWGFSSFRMLQKVL